MKLIVVLLVLLVSEYQCSEKCLAIALQGGGDHGAWEVGALRALQRNYPLGYDVISGVSIGAINAMYLGSFSQQQHQEAVSSLEQQWRNISSDNIYIQPTFFNVLYNINFRSGLLDNSPETSLLRSLMGTRTGIVRPTTIGITDATNGQYVTRDLDTLNNTDAVTTWVQASTSIPAIFQLMQINNTIYMDGGVMQNLDIGSAIRRCREQGYTNEQIIIDILMCDSGSQKGWHYTFLNAFQSLFRFLEISDWASSNDDVLHAQYDFPNVTFRGIYRPLKKLNTISIFFNPKEIADMIEQGDQDTQKIIDDYKAKNIQK